MLTGDGQVTGCDLNVLYSVPTMNIAVRELWPAGTFRGCLL